MMSFKKWCEAAAVADVMSPEEIFIPGPNLNVPRAQMPQIQSKLVGEFLSYLRENGVEVWKDKVPADQLRPIQADINSPKVVSMMRRTDLETGNPPIVSADNYILDGHHRWLALLNVSRMQGQPGYPMPVWRADTDMRSLLNLAKSWPKIGYKTIDQMKWA